MEIGSDPYLRSMLCLSAITYRGFADVTHGELHRQRLRGAILRALEEFAPQCGSWRLVWGPASYRAAGAAVDDSMMYVAQHATQPDRYVVAVRGTNPISAFDWLLGDVWVSRPVAWADETHAKISMSTALGLTILLSMRSTHPNGAAPAALDISADEAALLAGARMQTIEATLNQLCEDHGALDSALLQRLATVGQVAEAPASGLKLLWASIRHSLHDAVFNELSASVRDAPASEGEALISFLRGEAERRPIEITVTGHSKGGALAPALALTLAETADLGPATVHCAAFAGPSPGNAAFAERFARRFDGRHGGHFDRVVNPRDVVPHAWESTSLKRVADLYDPGPACPLPLQLWVDAIERQVGSLGYAHLDGLYAAVGPTDTKPSFAAQMVYEHLDGYLAALGLEPRTTDFFNPLA
jgi:hypothetical protein